MRLRPLSPRGAHALTLVFLAVFVAAGCWVFAWHALPRGDDLGSSYLGCRLLGHGQGAHLYSYDEDQFSDTGDDDEVWEREADSGGYTTFHHPYVQTPLWAWALRPLCEQPWTVFERVFVLLSLVAFAGSAWIPARFWSPAPRFGALLTASLLLWLWYSQPFQYAMFLAQTHVFFVLLTLVALVLAERGRPVLAGAALAVAVAVKVTPAAFLLYWLVSRRWKAAASAACLTALLTAAGYLATGPTLMHAYWLTLDRAAHTLLLSANNQSLAAWWMGRFYPASEINHFTIFPLPAAFRAVATVLLAGAATLGGLLDRRTAAAPAGAMLTLVATTVFAPIAWTHYGIVLYAPLFVLASQAYRLRWRPMLLFAAGIAALNVTPFTPDMLNLYMSPVALLRAQFFAFALALLGLAATGVALSRRHPVPHDDTAVT